MPLTRPKQLPPHWPRWNRRCQRTNWRTGLQCKSFACTGADHCRRHGGHGEVSGERAWKRFLLWALLPDAIREGLNSPLLDHEVEAACQIIATAALTGDAHASDAVRMRAAEWLLQEAAVATHPDPALLLTMWPREDAEIAIRILRDNGLMR